MNGKYIIFEIFMYKGSNDEIEIHTKSGLADEEDKTITTTRYKLYDVMDALADKYNNYSETECIGVLFAMD